MKQTRKIMSPTFVTWALVELGLIIGTPYCCATRPPAIESELATSPRSAVTWSSVIRR